MRRELLALVLLVAAAGWAPVQAQSADFNVDPLTVQLETRGGRQAFSNVTVTNTGSSDISRIYVLLDPALPALQRNPTEFPLPVGASATVTLTLTGGAEPLSQQIFLFFSKIDVPALRRTVQVNVRVVVPLFAISGDPIAFDVLPGTSAVSSVTVANTGTLAPLGLVARLSSSLSTTLELSASPQSLTLADGRSQNVSVAFAGASDSLLRSGTLNVDFPGDNLSPAVSRTFPVSVRVRAVEFFPAALTYNLTMFSRSTAALNVINRQRTRSLRFNATATACWIRGLNVSNEIIAPGATSTVSFAIDNNCLGAGPVSAASSVLVTTDAEGSPRVGLPASIDVPPGRPPVVVARVEGAVVYNVTAPVRLLRLVGSDSRGVDAAIVSYQWKQVNIYLTPTVDIVNATLPNARVPFITDPGYYQFQLTVTDGLNKTSSQIAVCVVAILVVQANLRLNNEFAPFDVSFRLDESFRANFINRLALLLRVSRNAISNVLLSSGSVNIQMYVRPGPLDSANAILARMLALTQPEIEVGLGYVIQNSGFTNTKLVPVSNPTALTPVYPQGYTIDPHQLISNGQIAACAVTGAALFTVIGGTIILYRRYRKRRRKYRQAILEQAAAAETYGAEGPGGPLPPVPEEAVPGAFPQV